MNVGGIIATDTIWTAANSPYILTDTVTVEAGVTLTIEAGVTVMTPDMGEYLDIQGHLQAVGTAVSPILFTSMNDLVSNNWSGTAAFGLANLANVTLRHAYTALFISGRNGDGVFLEDSVIEENLTHPVVVDTDALHRLTMNNVTFWNNLPDRIGINRTNGTVDKLNLAGNVLLSSQPGLEAYEFADAGLPQTPPAQFVVPSGVTLKEEPGVMLQFGDGAEEFVVNGRFITLGTLSQPIPVTSSSNAIAGDWLGVLVNGEVDLTNTAVRYGSQYLTLLGGGVARLVNTRLTQAQFSGLRLVGGSATAVRSQFSNNGTPTATIGSSALSGNGSAGLRNLCSVLINAQNNWWGDASGPSGTGSGSGDGVEGNVSFQTGSRMTCGQCCTISYICPAWRRPD